ncbi:DUF4126 domain-containing protein [Aquihabitans daechungensis]|uniref:DUF4126 domain-containing protein n=1 Tax=Aquihabitans daechungensis TaxID=1052257 RepID=UPI003BA01CFB
MPFGTIMASGWASGLNLYGTVLLLGLAGRWGWADTPSEIQEPWVLAVMGVMYVLEFVVDKVPWADSLWDSVHTVIRPLGGGLLGALFAADAGDPEVIAALLGGGFSLSAHGAKASTRALANTSPEPVSNIGLSLAEDGVVAGMVALALAFPVIAGIVATAFAIASVAVTWILFRTVRKLWRRIKARWARRQSGVP